MPCLIGCFALQSISRKSAVGLVADGQKPTANPPAETLSSSLVQCVETCKLCRMQAKSDATGEWLTTRILVVDDDVELCELVQQYLGSQGFRVDAVHDGTAGVAESLSNSYDLVILDVMLPGIRGFEALRQIRAKSAVPVVMLTAHGEDVDRIVGLEIGADDYMPKPFNPRELAARIHAVLRRTGAGIAREGKTQPAIALGDIRLDPLARTAYQKDRQVELTSAEFELLTQFLKAPGQVLTREDLVKNPAKRDGDPDDPNAGAVV